MSQQDFSIWVFCWVEDNLTELQQGTRLRNRGSSPKLSDAEVITMEVIGCLRQAGTYYRWISAASLWVQKS